MNIKNIFFLLFLVSIYLCFKSESDKTLFSFLNCKKSYDIQKSNCRENQLTSSIDRNSDDTETATDLHSNECSKLQYCLVGSSDSSCESNHSKEYFTVGNKYDPSGLSSLLSNNIIPDNNDDDDEIVRNSISNNSNYIGTLGRNNNKALSKVINQNCLPNKSFNTYSNQKDINLNNKNIQNTQNSSNNEHNNGYSNTLSRHSNIGIVFYSI